MLVSGRVIGWQVGKSPSSTRDHLFPRMMAILIFVSVFDYFRISHNMPCVQQHLSVKKMIP